MNINLLKLQIIELIHKHKKITAVAEILKLKQPTITFHMKSLERELGVHLFESKLGKISLTEEGLALQHYAEKINALAQEAERVLKDFQNFGKGTLKIGASYVPGTYILPSLISSIVKANPKITINLTLKAASTIKELLLNHQIDIGIFSSDPFHLPPLWAEKLLEDELVIVYPPDYPLFQCQNITPEMLENVPFIYHSPKSSTRILTEKWQQSNRVELNPIMEIDSLEAIKQIVMHGDGISFLSKLAIYREVNMGELAYCSIPKNDVHRYVFYAINENRKNSALLDEFIQRMVKKAPTSI